jgi:hypothetical protein
LITRLFAHKRTMAISLACLLVALGAIVLRVYLRNPLRGLPYRDSFSRGSANEWKAFGGTWELHDGTMRNDSDERGARLTTGSVYWHDYSIEADVMLPSSGGDAGLVIRTSDEEPGVDAYTGYYVGIRSLDNTLVMGRAGHGWMENSLTLKQATVQPSLWYHLNLMTVGCQIAATVAIASSGGTATVSALDKDCIPSGRAGLRSYASGGVWRNVVIRSATQQDLAAMLERGKPSESSNIPGFAREHRDSLGFDAPIPLTDPYRFHSSSNTQPIEGLRLKFLSKEAPAIRGNVIVASPMLFVQDITGGVSVPSPVVSPSLKVVIRSKLQAMYMPPTSALRSNTRSSASCGKEHQYLPSRLPHRKRLRGRMMQPSSKWKAAFVKSRPVRITL